MATFNFKQGDSAPALETTLRDDDGNAIDLSDASAVTIYVDDGGDSPSLIVNDTATISDAQAGEIKYEWSNQLGAEPENYRLEYVIDWSDGDTQTIPDRGFETLVISDTTARNIGLTSVDDPDASITTLFVDEIDVNSGTEINVNATVDMQGNDIQTAGAVDADSASISGQTTTGALDTDALESVADHIVTSKSELQTAVSNVSAGEVIFIGSPDTPFRTDQWLDIDVDGVSVVAQSRYAANGEALIKVADGADVGGLRIGFNSAVKGVTVKNFGFDGNTNNQDDTVKRLHGIIVDDATDCDIRDCFVTRTHPYQEHSSGGTGILLTENSEDCSVDGNRVDDAGDRSIAVVGDDHTIHDNTCINGYDRGISLQYKGLGGTNWYVANDTTVSNNTVRDMSDGSAIKGRGSAASSSPSRPLENITVVGNTVEGRCNEGIGFDQLQSDQQNIVIDGNTIVQTTSNAARAGIRVFGVGNADSVAVSDNTILNATRHGIEIEKLANGTVTGNTVRSSAEHGIIIRSCVGSQIENNTVQSAGDDGVVIDSCTSVDVAGHIVRNPTNWAFDVINCTDVAVESNRVFAGSNGGVRLDSGCNGAIVIHNDLRSGGTTPIDDSGTGTITDPVNQDKTEDYNIS